MLDLLADIGAQIGLAIERSRTEDRLRVLSSVVEQSPVSILVTDLEGKIEYVNARTAELTGYPIAELVGRNPRILNSGETPAQVYRQLWATLANGGEWRGTFHNRRKNGELFWEAARIRPILDDSGKATHYLAVKEDITARKEMEAALKASEERFRMAATSSSDVIYEWDILSDRTQIFGGSRGQLGRSIHSHPKTSAEYRQMIHPDDRERLVAAVELHLTTGAPFSQEYRLVYPEGDVHYVSDEGAAVRDSAGNPYKWIGVIRDVTEQKMAELARAQLASIVESADAAIISRDLDGNVLTWNNGAEQIFGYSADEMIGRSLDALCPPDRLHESRSLLEKIRQGESVRHFETMRVTKDGRTIHVLTTLSPICDQSGALAGTSQVIWDVTERKRTELALAENEERLRLITENISEVVAMTDDRLSQWFYVSPTYERVTGRTLQSLYDDPMSFLEGIHPDDRDRIRESIVSRMARHLPLDLEFRTRGQDLTTRWFWIRAFPLMSPQIEGCRYVGVGVDTTHLKQLERQLAQSQKLESIGQLAAGIAHEINTPIQYIGDNGKFLESAFEDLVRMVDTSAGATGRADGDLDYLRDEIPHAIEQLLDGVSRVAAIVHAMKEFSHPGFIEKVPLDINRAIENTILVSRNEWKYCADLTTDLDPSLPAVLFVAGEFNQVILNLIVNAAHAIGSVAEKRGVQGSIHLKTLLADAAVEIRVADNGCGIPEEIRSKVFDPFFTTKPVGKGTGQGLAIAHSIIVQKHGGSIHLESEVGKGTTFVIRLPLE